MSHERLSATNFVQSKASTMRQGCRLQSSQFSRPLQRSGELQSMAYAQRPEPRRSPPLAKSPCTSPVNSSPPSSWRSATHSAAVITPPSSTVSKRSSRTLHRTQISNRESTVSAICFRLSTSVHSNVWKRLELPNFDVDNLSQLSLPTSDNTSASVAETLLAP